MGSSTTAKPPTEPLSHRWRRRVRQPVKSARGLGHRVRRATPVLSSRTKASGDRLVPSPVFVLSSVRSGSTLLRVMLNTHSRIVAPHEMHLRTIRVSFDQPYTELAMKQLGLDVDSLEHLLWDRILHRELVRSGKSIVVDKTPGNSFIWKRLDSAWPDARFIFLLRNPASVVASQARARPDKPLEAHIRNTAKYVRNIEAARAELSGITVRYEDLVADPEQVLTSVCDYLGVRFEPAMLEYGREGDHGPFRTKIGDWSANIKSGKVQPPTPPPSDDELTPEIRALNAVWGY